MLFQPLCWLTDHDQVLKYLDKLAAPSKSIGSCNTVYLEFPEGSDKPILVGT